MSRVIRSVWENAYGLLVDDGQLALGAAAALVVTWLLAHYAGDAVRQMAGWVLVALVVALVIANTYRAGHDARRRLRR